ncbi:MAG TPA: GGDEF domain-containing protein [Candidatus Paceibacterota bacterium]
MKSKRFGAEGPQPEATAEELKEQLEAALAENIALKAEIADLKIDSVTGLPTRRELDKRIAESRSKEKMNGGQEGGPEKELSNETAVLMLDIDNFKVVNDLYGHPNADIILRAVADKLREMFRKEDSVMRYGGEEIAVILQKTDAKRLIHKFYDSKAGKPRLTVKTTIIHKGKEEEVEVTLSGGLASFGPDGDLHTALTQADEALYVAKNGVKTKDGNMVTPERDRIVLYSEDMGKEQASEMEPAA